MRLLYSSWRSKAPTSSQVIPICLKHSPQSLPQHGMRTRSGRPSCRGSLSLRSSCLQSGGAGVTEHSLLSCLCSAWDHLNRATLGAMASFGLEPLLAHGLSKYMSHVMQCVHGGFHNLELYIYIYTNKASRSWIGDWGAWGGREKGKPPHIYIYCV